MSDMIGLLRFGMPLSQAPVAPLVEGQSHKAAPEVSAVSGSSGGGQAGGGQAAANYTATPRPAISPQFAYASAGEPPVGNEATAVVAQPKPFDPDVITGPPPTFEATLLELEAHLRMSLARIDVLRNVHALDRPTPVEKPKTEAAPAEVQQASAQKAESAAAGDAEPAPEPVRQPGGAAATNAGSGDADAMMPILAGAIAKGRAEAAPRAAAMPAYA